MQLTHERIDDIEATAAPPSDPRAVAAEFLPHASATSPINGSEELCNAITHGLGLLLSIVGCLFLMDAALMHGGFWQIFGSAIYSTTLLAVYGASTLSHVFQSPRQRRWFRMLDQGCIYLYIAGTYTPLALAFVPDRWILAVVWAIAIAGFCSKVFFAHRVEAVSTLLYVLLGWIPALAAQPLLNSAPPGMMWWVAAGGLCYTVGVLFLTFDEKVAYFHGVWHMLVIAGSTCHYVAIFSYSLHGHLTAV